MFNWDRLINDVAKVYLIMEPEDKKKIHSIFDIMENLKELKNFVSWEKVVYNILRKYKGR
jgi:hypothetical protein